MADLNEPVFGFIKCPICGDLTRASSYRCQACNSVLKARTETPIETFSSEGRVSASFQQQGQRQPQSVQLQKQSREQGASSNQDQGRPPSIQVQQQNFQPSSVIIPQSGDVFSSENRQVANGGYTQQHTTEEVSKKYAGVEAVATGVFSSDNRKVYGKKYEYVNKEPTGYETFSSETYAQQRTANEQTVKVNADSDVNPYGTMTKVHYLDELDKAVDEYVATDIFEFRKHRFGKRIADLLDILLDILVVVCFVIVVLEQLFTSLHMPVIFDIVTFAFCAIVILCVITIKHTWNKANVYFLSGVVMIYSAFMIIGILVGHHPVYRSEFSGGFNNAVALEPMVVFMPMAAADAITASVIILIAKLYTLWEAYQHRDEEAAEAKVSKGEFMRVFKSRGEQAENFQSQADD